MGAWNGPLWIPAWQLHDRDPTLIMWKVSCIGFLHLSQVPQPTTHDSVTNYIQAVYNNMSGSAFRRNNMARLHVYPEEEVEKADFKLVSSYTHINHSGARRDHEKRDFSNTSSEACTQETVGFYRRGKAELS